jgi:hypothetical protein
MEPPEKRGSFLVNLLLRKSAGRPSLAPAYGKPAAMFEIAEITRDFGVVGLDTASCALDAN